MKRVVIVFVVLTVALTTGLWLKVRELRAAKEAPAGSSAVVEATELVVASKLGARVVAVHAKEGQRVKKGALLVELDCREPRALLAAATAKLRAAEGQAAAAAAQALAAKGQARAARAQSRAAKAQGKALAASKALTTRQERRIRSMERAGGATAAELDRITTQLTQVDRQLAALHAQHAASRGQASAAAARATASKRQAAAAHATIAAARAELTRAKLLAEDCLLHAPADAVVEHRAREPGELVLPGSTLLTLLRTDRLEAVFYLPNRELAAARPGGAVTVRADAYPKRRFRGTIVRVSREAEFTARTVQTRDDRDRLVYAVTALLRDPQDLLRAGMPVEVMLVGSGKADASALAPGPKAKAEARRPAPHELPATPITSEGAER